ncbi:MAG: hypothetical protein ACREHE_09680 [Rhizomicrobium sp.]
MRICLLGWGSLLWDDSHPEFDEQHEEWKFDGPPLKLEFSRISKTRKGALTLVIDPVYGSLCNAAYAMSKRVHPDDAICDLRCREGTVLKKIGYMFLDSSREPNGRDKDTKESIRSWALLKKIDVVVWTDLSGNFAEIGKSFSLESARAHLQNLTPEGKAKAAEYVWRAPKFIDTPLRQLLQKEPWFQP